MQVGSRPPFQKPDFSSQNTHVQEIRVSVCLEDGTPIAAELVELARMDLMLRVDRPLRYGTPIRLVLFRDFARGVAHCRAVVHWCRTEQGSWRLGAFLTTPIADSITERCGGELRAHLRYPAGWKSWVRIEPTGRLEQAIIHDYSIAGICSQLPCPAEAGQQLSLFSYGSGVPNSEIPVRVQWCRPYDGGFLTGCFIPGHRGKDLPGIFENHDAIHADLHGSDLVHAANDPSHVSWIEQSLQECFHTVQEHRQIEGEDNPSKIRLEQDHSGGWTMR